MASEDSVVPTRLIVPPTNRRGPSIDPRGVDSSSLAGSEACEERTGGAVPVRSLVLGSVLGAPRGRRRSLGHVEALGALVGLLFPSGGGVGCGPGAVGPAGCLRVRCRSLALGSAGAVGRGVGAAVGRGGLRPPPGVGAGVGVGGGNVNGDLVGPTSGSGWGLAEDRDGEG